MLGMRGFRTGKTLVTVSLASVCLAGLVIAGAASSAHNGTSTAGQSAENDQTGAVGSLPVSPVWVARAIGVTPESAAAAGLDRDGVSAVLAHCSAHLREADNCSVIENLIALRSRQLEALRHEARRFGLTDARAEELREVEAAVEMLRIDRDRAVGALTEAIRPLLIAHVGQSGADILRNYTANETRRVPRAYRCLGLDEAQWDYLASALDKTAINAVAQRDDDIDMVELTQEEINTLALANSSPDVAVVAVRLANLLPEVLDAFVLSAE